MKNLRLISAVLIIFFAGCKTPGDISQVVKDLKRNLDCGNISNVMRITDSLKKHTSGNDLIIQKADSLAQIAERTGIDFSVPEQQFTEQIEKKTGSFSKEDMIDWEKKGWLEWRLINGNKMYFKRSASNLLLLKNFYENREERLSNTARDPGMIFRLKHTGEIYKLSENQGKPVVPVNMSVTYTITLHPDAIPAGEKVRCWMPWPKESHPRQRNVKLLSSSSQDYIIAPDSAIHSSIYMEGVSKKGVPTLFQISFNYQSSGQYFSQTGLKIPEYDKTSDTYIKYTSEQLPQICFTENVKRLADSITGKDDNPEAIVRKVYYWFKNNIPWTGALEYSIMPNITEYVYKNRRGDCGMQTFLFMSMLRYKGVPVRWQSGWMMPPDDKNLHDWCEVYYEGSGWIPADVSYDLQQSDNTAIKEFYISGIDSYRLIVNDGIAGPLHPAKQFLRSEPFDFQRGEVEWRRGNLYFDKWDYEMKIDYLK
jgi:hypothetical protein